MYKRQVHPGDGEAQTRHGLAQEAAATADVQKPKARERRAGAAVAAKPLQGLLPNEGEAHGIDLVQGGQFAARIPPVVRDGREARNLFRIDA